MSVNDEIILKLREYISNPRNIKYFPRCVEHRRKLLKQYEQSNKPTGTN